MKPVNSREASRILQHLEEKVDEEGAAAVLACAPKTLANWRVAGKGPVYLKIGGAVRYRLSDLYAYLDGCVRRSTSDRGEGAADDVA